MHGQQNLSILSKLRIAILYETSKYLHELVEVLVVVGHISLETIPFLVALLAEEEVIAVYARPAVL